jgi:ABC-type lipoprotein export system ATPase subunit
MGLLHELHASGATIVVITHDREIADSLPRQVAVRDGLIELDTGSGYADRTDNQRRNNGFVALTEEGTLR